MREGPLYAVYAHNDGYGVLATTIEFPFYVLGVIPVLLAFGGLSDRIGRRKTILIALALSVAATALMLFYPYTRALAVARFVLGVGTALMAATATAYMIELLGSSDTMRATAWVTASTTIGFGLGPVLTTVSLMFYETDQPASFFLLLASGIFAMFLLYQLPETAPKRTGLAKYAGISSMLAISCGLIVQPIARKLDPQVSSKLGLLILLPAYALLAWGTLNANLPVILLAAFLASTSCYGFVYLGGMLGVAKSAGNEQARASAGYFLMAYIGLSVPVIFTGLIVDRYGAATAFYAFGVFSLVGVIVLFASQPMLRTGRHSNANLHSVT